MALIDRVSSIVTRAVRAAPQSRVSRSTAYRLGDQMGRRRSTWTGRVITGGAIDLDLRDHHHRQVYFFGEAESHVAALVRQRLKGGVVLDVGANAGFFSVLAADLGASRVIAFEPSPRALGLIGATASRDSRITLERSAVGAKEGTASLRVSEDVANAGTSSFLASMASGGQVMVPVVTVDGYCDEHRLEPELVKIDVEGHELAVLQGMQAVLERGVPTIVCEVGSNPGRPAPSEVVEYMAERGYVAHSIEANGGLEKLIEVPEWGDLCFAPDPD